MEKASLDWPIVLQYDVKAKYRLIFRKFSGMKFFSGAFALPTKSHARLCPFDKPFKSRVFISRSYENRAIVIVWAAVNAKYKLK